MAFSWPKRSHGSPKHSHDEPSLIASVLLRLNIEGIEPHPNRLRRAREQRAADEKSARGHRNQEQLAEKLTKLDPSGRKWDKRDIVAIENPNPQAARKKREGRLRDLPLLAQALEVTLVELTMGLGNPGSKVVVNFGEKQARHARTRASALAS